MKKEFKEPEVKSEKIYAVAQCNKCQTAGDITGLQCNLGVDKS